MMVTPLLAMVVQSAQTQSWRPLILFFIFAIAGVVGETIVSLWWHLFFGQRFWTYIIDTLYHKYTSWLNFIPWGLGGVIYTNILNNFIHDAFGNNYAGLEYVFGLGIILAIFTQIIIFHLILKRNSGNKFHKITTTNFLFFYGPIGLLIILLATIYGQQIYYLAVLFGAIATIAEYLFGKATELFISKKLWVYNYVAIDRGHFTPLSVPLFALAGFYFWAVTEILGLM